MDELTASRWLTLIFAPKLGAAKILKIIDHLGCINPLFDLDQSELESLNLASVTAKAIITPDLQKVEQHLKWLEQPHHHLVTIQDTCFPPLLLQSSHKVSHFFAVGCTSLLSSPQLAMVGSRHPTQAGQHNAFHFAQGLAESGYTITSGLARGIDAYSHQGALQSSGKTIAVVGTGLDRCYPSENKPLAKKILDQGGCIVSEYPLGIEVKPYHFPARNRIIAGLSQGVLVVEAALKSGSLITAKLAAEDNREVFALPDSIHNTAAKGCHWLIKQGAKLVECIDDISSELQGFAIEDHSNAFVQNTLALEKTFDDENNSNKPVSASSKKQQKKHDESTANQIKPATDISLSVEQQAIFDILSYQPMSIDDIIAASQLSTQDVSVNLLNLELDGLVLLEANGYVRNISH